MKKLFTIITITILFCSGLKAQDTTFYPKYALSFGIGSNFTLKNFDMDIAVKKVIDQTHQLRFFISPRILTVDQDEETTESSRTSENIRNSYSIGLGADYLWTLLQNNDFQMFGGSGIKVEYGNEYREATTNSEVGERNISKMKKPSGSVGLRGILGVEWKVSDKVGIHSEYLLTFSYSREKIETDYSLNDGTSYTVTRNSSGLSLGSSVLFGLSIYF